MTKAQIKSPDACTVISTTDPTILSRYDYLVCT